MVRFDIVLSSLGKGLGFLKREWKTTLRMMIKIDLIAFFTIALLVTIGCGAIYIGGTGFSNTRDWTTLGFGLAGLIFFGGIGLLAGSAIHSTTYNLVESRIENKPFEMKGNAMRNLFPTILWLVLWTIFIILAFSPYVLYVWSLTSSGIDPSEMGFRNNMAVNATGQFTENIIEIVLMLLSFFFIFALFELLVARKGFFKSLGNSVTLVKGNFWETLAFQIGTTMISTMVGFVLILPMIAAAFILAIVGIPAIGMMRTSPLIGIVLMVLLAVLATIGLAIVSAITSMITKPLIYYYWKAIRPNEETLKTRAKKN